MPLGRGEVNLAAVAVARDLGGEVDLDVAEPRRPAHLGGGGAPGRRPQPGEQLVDAERLGHVVIGAEVERGHLVGAAGAR